MKGSASLPYTTAEAIRIAGGRILPLLAVGYILCCIDRANIGFAALTMNKELGLTATQFGFAAGVFWFGYCLFELPSNLALRRFGARRCRRLRPRSRSDGMTAARGAEGVVFNGTAANRWHPNPVEPSTLPVDRRSKGIAVDVVYENGLGAGSSGKADCCDG